MQVFLITLLWTLLSCYIEPQLYGEENTPPVPNTQIQQRLALVIGNGAYTAMPDSLQQLINPVNDAEDIATQLSKFGFEVTLLKNGTLEAMDEAIHSFSSKINKGDVALLYYSGHGIQVGGENFLLPVDAKFKREDQVERQAIKSSLLLDKLDNASTKLVFLDACRNNPFLVRSTRAFGRTGQSRNGLAKLPAPDGTLLVYSTDPDNVAEDGSGRNSPFTQGLLKFIGSPGVDVQLMLREVRKEVKRNTDNRQTPWDNSSLEDTFYFVPVQENQQLPVEETQLADIKRQQEGIAGAVRQSEELERQKQDYLAAYNAGDYAKAIKILSALVKQGDAWSQGNLGVMYQNGYGVTQDYNEAVKWYYKAAEQGNASAQDNLGSMYQNGKGIAQDYTEAVKWSRKAAEQGNVYGQNRLGFMYEKGYGVTQDYTEAVKWYSKAAEQGYADGQTNLGIMYRDGKGVTQDYREAVKWYRKAADQGYVHGQNRLGFMYEKGYGVTQDYTEAVKWYRKTAAQGNAYGQNRLDFIHKKGFGITKKSLTVRSFLADSSHMWLVIASKPTIEETQTLARQYQAQYPKTTIFLSENGWYTISVGLLEFPKQEYLKDQWIKQGLIPPDSYFTQGNRFIQQIDF